jgi:hypothetical protein
VVNDILIFSSKKGEKLAILIQNIALLLKINPNKLPKTNVHNINPCSYDERYVSPLGLDFGFCS